MTMLAARSLGAPTCSRRGVLEEQEVKVPHREEAEQTRGRGGAGVVSEINLPPSFRGLRP